MRARRVGPVGVRAGAVGALALSRAGARAIVVGALGAPQPRDLCDSEYDQLFVVVIGDTGPPRLIRSRYGAANVDDPSCAAMQPR